MIKATRLSKIKEILIDKKQIDVNSLASLFNVSIVTVRSDLEILEKQNFLIRTHGGAVLNEESINQLTNTSSFFIDSIEYDANKEIIGQIAADMVKPNEWIFLSTGITCYYIAKALVQKKFPINVITNNLYAATALAQNPLANIIVSGGNLNHTLMSLSGDFFLRSLDNLYVSKVFACVAGIDFNGGFTIAHELESAVYEKLKTISKELIVVADYTKFNNVSFMKIGDLDFANTIITNENVPDEYKTFFFENGVKLFTTYRINASSVGGF